MAHVLSPKHDCVAVKPQRALRQKEGKRSTVCWRRPLSSALCRPRRDVCAVLSLGLRADRVIAPKSFGGADLPSAMCAALYCDPRLASIGDPSLTRRNECPWKYLNSATCFAPSCYTSSVILGLGVSLMRRREFIALLGGGVAGWPLAVHAQERTLPVIGYLNFTSSDTGPSYLSGFHRGLAEAGYVEGKKVANRVPLGRQ